MMCWLRRVCKFLLPASSIPISFLYILPTSFIIFSSCRMPLPMTDALEGPFSA